jgi:hypothetical protein
MYSIVKKLLLLLCIVYSMGSKLRMLAQYLGYDWKERKK